MPQPYCRKAVAKERAYPRHTQRVRVGRGMDMPRVSEGRRNTEGTLAVHRRYSLVTIDLV